MKNKDTLISSLVIISFLSILNLMSAVSYAGNILYKGILFKHTIWLGLGWVIFLILLKFRLPLYELAGALYLGGLMLLFGVLILGKEVGGSQRWLGLGGFSFQPSEIMKFAILAILAFWWHRYFQGISFFMSWPRVFWYEFLAPLILTAVPAFLVFLEPDLGTAIFYILIFICMYFFLPLKKKYILYFIMLGILASPLLFPHLKDYQKKRLLIFLNPQEDPFGAGYTIIQAKIAIGSGGVAGKGFMSGTQSQFNFLPERHTDFIFSVYAEEWGFVGCVFLLLLYFFILKFILYKRSQAITNFDKIYAQAVFFYFLLHIFINIGMNLGLLPVVGLPLPFLTYGGTHTILDFFLLGSLFSLKGR